MMRTLFRHPAVLAVALTALLAPASAQTDAANVLRVYDVSTLEVAGEASEQRHSRLLPSTVYERDDLNSRSELDQDSSFELLSEVIRDVYGEEFEYEGRRFETARDGRLIVRGPVALHDRVTRLIEFFETVINSQAELEVFVVRLPRESETPAPAALLDEKELQGLLASAQLSRYSMSLRADRDAILDLSKSRPILIDYDVEIAQAAAISDPIVKAVQDGTRFVIRSAPGVGGLHLAVMMKRGDIRQSAEGRYVNTNALVTSEGGTPTFIRSSSRFPDVQLANRSVSFTSFLPKGKALAVRTKLGVDGTVEYDEVVVFRQVGGALPTLHEMAIENAGGELLVADLGSVAPPSLFAEGGLLRETELPCALENRLHHEPLLDAGFRENDFDFMQELVASGTEFLAINRIGRWLLARPYGEYIGTESAQVVADQKRLKERFTALQRPAQLLDVSVTVKRPRSGEPVQARIPMRAGTSVTLAIGVESWEVSDFDVEVAQFSAVADPVVRSLFDGAALWIKPMLSRQGELVVDVRGAVNLLGDRERFELESRVFDSIESTPVDQLFLSDRRKLKPTGNDGEWSVTLGDAAGGGIAVEIVVRKV
ncbi:MAG: hypothetical protein GY711_34585 [bacterium]|nr:hypothetical protein [bacterium]